MYKQKGGGGGRREKRTISLIRLCENIWEIRNEMTVKLGGNCICSNKIN
jgi:hypothetical protein